jgi:hypothetical protein
MDLININQFLVKKICFFDINEPGWSFFGKLSI